MKKSRSYLQNQENQKGQLTIFFAISITLIISIIAFVVNVGLYVKAKINLQNAVDAAAWSGASVQARQLSQIGYLNWEMRNNYKEWMFKYYVLGQYGIPMVENPNASNSSQMNFRMMDFQNANSPNPTYNRDRFNVPSICIHFAGSHNICKIFNIPGLPRFENIGLPDLDETHNSFLDQIVDIKSRDCAKRSEVNFFTAMSWAFGTKATDPNVIQNTPEIAIHRVGAWPKGIELAFRIRNLEYILNTPPESDGLCFNPGTSDCGKSISELENTGIPNQERSVKAFYSAWRNLGNSSDRELKDSFVLTELAPRPLALGGRYSISNLLIPESVLANYRKYYVDLRLYLLNLVTFYTAFVTTTSTPTGGTAVFDTEEQAACSATKVGLPIPGFPLGFDKNPAAVTYYAVKGTARFTGLFNPFGGDTLITAYSAAKPFGGRIGPRLFSTDGEVIRPRLSISGGGSLQGFRSRQYLSSLGLNNNQYQIGNPIPVNGAGNPFWVTNDNNAVVGGLPSSSDMVSFAIPNLIYELTNMPAQSGGSDKIQLIDQNHLGETGLYDKDQFALFRSHLPAGGSLTPSAIESAIKKIRAPTHYEALNYLIPHADNNHNANPIVQTVNGSQKLTLWAPLYQAGGGLVYNDMNDIVRSLNDLIEVNKKAVEAYVDSLALVATEIANEGSNIASDATLYNNAAKTFWDGPSAFSTGPLSCNSIAGLFSSFYNKIPDFSSGPRCPRALSDSILSSWQAQAANSDFSTFYQEDFTAIQTKLQDGSTELEDLFSAYMPGPRHGAEEDGMVSHPFLPNNPENFKRNFYSAKFIPFEFLSGRSSYSYGSSSAAIYSEGGNSKEAEDIDTPFENDLEENGIDLIKIKQ
ncbi:MAG: Tad domain-containing protein [Bacteriovoracaceae bacterium]|nr:Tad domain-containing protein [Bacteriovoracaceae bacterium]